MSADYQSMIGLVADLQAKLELATAPDPALQERISDLTTSANATLVALQALDASFTPPEQKPEAENTKKGKKSEPAE